MTTLTFQTGEASQAEIAAGQGTKDDHTKVRYDLTPPEAEEQIGMLYTIGAKKYDDNNWLKITDRRRFWNAARRHMAKYMMGETHDIGPNNTGSHHLICAIWNLIALFIFDIRGIDRDPIPARVHPLTGEAQ